MKRGLAGVTFARWSASVAEEFANAAVLLAPGPRRAFGLSVLEAMAAGVPVVASSAGGHLETAGQLSKCDGCSLLGTPRRPPWHFGFLLSDNERAPLSTAGRRLIVDRFAISRHVDLLLCEYEFALS